MYGYMDFIWRKHAYVTTLFKTIDVIYKRKMEERNEHEHDRHASFIVWTALRSSDLQT